MVRDEAMGAAARPGKFQQPDEMKTVQETILELARSRTVLARRIGRSRSRMRSTDSTATGPPMPPIAALQSHVKLTPPKGAEFGKTEVFYLNVEAETRPRAVALAAAICKQLQSPLARSSRSKSSKPDCRIEQDRRSGQGRIERTTTAL